MIARMVVAGLLAAGPCLAAGPYAGLEERAIAALSSEDVADIEAGRGWGLALPAELNGYPGPLHVLELSAELALTEAQRSAVEAAFAAMQAEARARGADYVAAERRLDAVFRDGAATPEAVAAATADAGAALGALRAAHLTAHLETAAVLTPAQRAAYAAARGYGGGHGAQGGGHAGGHHGMKH